MVVGKISQGNSSTILSLEIQTRQLAHCKRSSGCSCCELILWVFLHDIETCDLIRGIPQNMGVLAARTRPDCVDLEGSFATSYMQRNQFNGWGHA